jgi:hypothetical protein
LKIKEAIDSLSSAITADPAKARGKNLPATARLIEGLKCELRGPYNERAAFHGHAAGDGRRRGWPQFRMAAARRAGVVHCDRDRDARGQLGMTLGNVEVTVETDSDLRGILGLDVNVSARHAAMRMKVKISAPGQPAGAHSPVSCTVKQKPHCSLEIEVA